MLNNTGVWVVIPNWNAEEVIGACLDSLMTQTVKPNIVVVDNGSIDRSIEIIEGYEKVHLVRLPKNTGFSGGVNTGITYAMKQKAEHIALFNNDAVAEKTWIEELKKTASNYPGAIITSLILLEDSTIDTVGETYSMSGSAKPSMRGEPASSAPSRDTEVFAGSGGATMYPASVIDKVGLFDEEFFAYYEDVDIGYRALQQGIKTILAHSAIVHHELSHTSNKLGDFKRYHAIKNIHLLFLKNTPGILLPVYGPLFLLYSVRLCVSSAIRLKPHVWLQSMARVLLLTPHILRSRKKLKENRTVGVKYIHSKLTKNII